MHEKMRSGIATLTSVNFPHIADIRNYVAHGDPKALAKVKPVGQNDRGWLHYLVGSIGDLSKWTDEDRRMIHVLVALDCVHELVGFMGWLPTALGREKADEDCCAALRAELERQRVPKKIIDSVIVSAPGLARSGKPNSAGRHALGLPDAELVQAVQAAPHFDLPKVVELLAACAPDRVIPVLQHLGFGKAESLSPWMCKALLDKAGTRFEALVAETFARERNPWWKFMIGRDLGKLNLEKYRASVADAARACLADAESSGWHVEVGEWLMDHAGASSLDAIIAYVTGREHGKKDTDRMGPANASTKFLEAATKKLDEKSVPILIAAIQNGYKEVGLVAMAHLAKFNDSHQHDILIQQAIGRWLDDNNLWLNLQQWGGSSGEIARALLQKNQRLLEIAAKVPVEPLAEKLWPMLSDKQATIRDGAARALAGLGDAALPRAVELLQAGKADIRKTAVTLLGAVGSDAALKRLEDRLDTETDEDVRDAILFRLDAAWSARGKKFTRKDIDARIARTADRLQEAVAGWLDEKKLPALHYVKDGKLERDAVRYLLYRQSRVKDIRMDAEAKPLFAQIDRAKSGDFALTLVQQFLASKMDAKDRWALTIAGLLGDARVVPLLVAQVRKWVDTSRAQMAEYGVHALALLTCDEALLALDALALRYRSKYKNVGQAALDAFAAAAERLGVSVDELGDRVVPWLGFEPGKPRVIEMTGIEVRIGPALKLQYYDPSKKKVLSALPKTTPAATLAEFKELAATLREISKSQVQRLENLLVRQHRWPNQRWQELFRAHPLLIPFSIRLVWGTYDAKGLLKATFRALEDGTLTTADDAGMVLPASGSMGMIHPLELDDAALASWRTHLADHEIEPPFPQLDRPVVRLQPEETGKRIHVGISGQTVNGLTFKGRVDRHGWVRGSVVDNGTVPAYVKRFASAGIDAVLRVDNMYMGIDANSEVELQDACFVRAGAVQIGGYSWDYPSKEDDERTISFGEVPPVVYSEVMGDLQKISGKSAAAVE